MNNDFDINQVKLGQPLPNWFIEPIFEEAAPDTQDFVGKPLLILIFSLGCPGCLGRALPYANSVVVEKGENIQVVGIHTNFEGVDFTQEQFAQAREEFFIRFPIFKDRNYNDTFYSYGAGGTPHWILTDAQGTVVYSIFGSDPNNALLRLDLKMAEVLENAV